MMNQNIILPKVLRPNIFTSNSGSALMVSTRLEHGFQLAKMEIPPTDSYEIVYAPPYFSPSGIYRGGWNNPRTGVYDDDHPIKLYWVVTDGQAEFSIDVKPRLFSKAKTVSINTPRDEALIGYNGVVNCDVYDCRFVIECEYVCGKSVFNRKITLHIGSNEVSQTQYNDLAKQITELLHSKGYQEFDDIFR